MFVSLLTMSIVEDPKINQHAVDPKIKTAICPSWTAKQRTLLNSQTFVSYLGGAYRDRTDDPLLAKQVLSQLS